MPNSGIRDQRDQAHTVLAINAEGKGLTWAQQKRRFFR